MLNKAACLLFVLGACTASTDEPITAPTPTPIASQPRAPATQALGDWRARVAADVSALRSANPARYDELRTLAPQTTRARTLRFTTDALHDPVVASVFLDRLASGTDTAEVRAALVEALPRTGGLYADAVSELIAQETTAAVRTAYVFSMRRAPADYAIAVFARGLADGTGEVQAEAARSAGAHADGAKLAGELRAALSSTEPELRTEAARSLGILKVAGAQAELSARLTDAVPEVRLEALRALERITPGSLAGRSALTTLANDPDPRVARLASTLAGRASTP